MRKRGSGVFVKTTLSLLRAILKLRSRVRVQNKTTCFLCDPDLIDLFAIFTQYVGFFAKRPNARFNDT
jgi:hypothetical protein